MSAETTRDRLRRHGLSEDDIDEVLDLHARELVTMQRSAHDARRSHFHMGLPCLPQYLCGVNAVIDLIDPIKTKEKS